MTSLTSPSFQLLTILATVAVSVATLLLWNRVRGPRPVRLLSRAGLLGSSYVLAAIAALVSINIAYGGLISGWGELLDNMGSTPSVGRHGRCPGHRPGGPPGQGHFPGQANAPGQGNFPGQANAPGQGNFPGQGHSPCQGRFPGFGQGQSPPAFNAPNPPQGVTAPAP